MNHLDAIGAMTRTATRTRCPHCAAGRCGDCERPGGAGMAADGARWPTCCCGRRFLVWREARR